MKFRVIFNDSSWEYDLAFVTVYSLFGALICAGVGIFTYQVSDRKALITAYSDCLRTMERRPIEDIHLFCNKISDQL